MSGLKFWQIALIGAILVIIGFLIPFLTVIRVLPSNLILLFFSYAASIVGVMLGIVSSAWYVYTKRKGRGQ